ncbi:phospholipase [Pseudotabrizicola sediminis]|uniref:Phospholipase n=2 Tax=Pseudotabrizicola sediminis TaxID=2486418 RepID=A0ABY2KJN6_9RHOB|nr:phospholipase [Pseudotabrizicola sediminis]
MMGGALWMGATDGARAVCVLVHGRGQSPEEMQAHVLARLDTQNVCFVMPRAQGGAWYAARATDALTEDTRSALSAARHQLQADIVAARAACPGLPLVLAGFSQGACLALEYVFSGHPAPDALVGFTGCRVGQRGDARPQALPPDLPVYLTGSDADPWIPVAAFADAVLDLGQGRARLRAELFPGRAHEVCDAEVSMLGTILTDLIRTKTNKMAALQ